MATRASSPRLGPARYEPAKNGVGRGGPTWGGGLKLTPAPPNGGLVGWRDDPSIF